MCDKVITLSAEEVKKLILGSLANGNVTASGISFDINNRTCLDGKCDSKATSYILNIISKMLEEKELIFDSNNNSIIVNDDYKIPKDSITQIFEITNKYEISGDNKIKLSRTEYFFSAWSSIYIGQKIEVLLVLEPDNPKDKNAIAVMFLGKQIGYLPRETSSNLNEFIKDKNNQGFNVVAHGEIIKQAMMGTKNCVLSL